ncbi:MAG: bifunctional nuclease family protein [Prevotella sp.]|nr:bifunctional nuclease family protein [Prevotella sp.]MCF0208891.1 bifunctional nuclease family protein [Bacteroidaceae bacterium]
MNNQPQIRLKFANVQEIQGAKLANLIVLVDEFEQRQLVVITDKPTAMNISANYESKQIDKARALYFERSALYVTLSLLPEEMKKLMYIQVDGLIDSQYHAHLIRRNADINEPVHELRMSEAVLLSIVSDIPLYIDKHLWDIQSTRYKKGGNGTSIPMNTLPLPMLKDALKKAIETEDYKMAKALNDEIKNRFPGEE